MNEVAENLKTLGLSIREAAAAAGREADSVTLVAVSKLQPEERIEAALAAGQRVFGENRVQEAKGRWAAYRRERYPDITLRMIGPLQTNKVKDAVALFDVIETLDRAALAQALAAEMGKQKRPLPCFVQVNTGAEPQKAGITLPDAGAFIDFCRDECGLLIEGLMCIPPVDEDPAAHFRTLRELGAAKGLRFLSMGMSADYAAAIAQGATHVRIGTAVFGNRK